MAITGTEGEGEGEGGSEGERCEGESPAGASWSCVAMRVLCSQRGGGREENHAKDHRRQLRSRANQRAEEGEVVRGAEDVAVHLLPA